MNKVTLLISSFDGFSDCWQPYLHGLKKYWSDCPYDVFIITNYKDIDDDRVKAIEVGKDKGWSANVLEALKHIKTPYVLYAQEDLWIKERVDSKVIDDYVAVLENDYADYIRLYPCPPPDYDFPHDERLGIIAKDANYRTSCQMSLWRKTVLEELIKPDENPWQFEINGTIRSRKYKDRFLCVKAFYNEQGERYHFGINYICTAINKGRWSKGALEYAKREGLNIDFSNRPNENWWHDFKRLNRLGNLCGKVESIAYYLVDKIWQKIKKFIHL